MASIFEKKDRNVIPNWRSFVRTLKSGELGYSFTSMKPFVKRTLSIDDYLFAWKKDKSVSIAGDLLSAAYVNNVDSTKEIQEAAEFVLSSLHSAPSSLKKLANLLIKSGKDELANNRLIKSLNEIAEPTKFEQKIREYRERIRFAPFNPINYVNLSRIYSVLGIKEKALKNMLIALNISRENRFVIRAAVRLFSHFDETDYAHRILKSSRLIKVDPWITSAEISISILLNRNPSFIKTGREMIRSQSYDWFSLTELASSIGTLEFINGNTSTAKKMLRTALNSPNDNSLAQLEWINNVQKVINFNPRDYEIDNMFESLALFAFAEEDYEGAVENAINWLIDLPFSKRPVMFGAHTALIFLENTELAVQFYKAGLTSHPNDPQLINNISYSLALQNKLTDAENYLAKLKSVSEINEKTKICVIATAGLLSFRRGDINEGIRLYETAITKSERMNNQYFTWLAKLNYVRELLLAKSNEKEKISNLLKIPDNTLHPDINIMKKKIIENNILSTL